MNVEISRAMPSEYRVILDALPSGWFTPTPDLLMLKVADMLNSQRMLIAHLGTEFVGCAGWQDNVAFGAMFASLAFVAPQHRKKGVMLSMLRELATIAIDNGYRGLFVDFPSDSPLIAVAKTMPGAREAGYIDGLHQDGVRSVIFGIEVAAVPGLVKHLSIRIAKGNEP